MAFAGARPILAKAEDAGDFMARMAAGNTEAYDDGHAPIVPAAGREAPRIPIAAHWPEAECALAVPLAHGLRIPQNIIEPIMKIVGVTWSHRPKSLPTSPRHCLRRKPR